MEPRSLSTDQRRTLLRLVELLVPHPGVAESVFDRTAAHVADVAATDEGVRRLLIRHLEDLTKKEFALMKPPEAGAEIGDLEGTPFFRFLRAETVNFFYSEMDVYAVLGYEGPSFDKGGYINRGFDDLDWLPDPYDTDAVSS